MTPTPEHRAAQEGEVTPDPATLAREAIQLAEKATRWTPSQLEAGAHEAWSSDVARLHAHAGTYYATIARALLDALGRVTELEAANVRLQHWASLAEADMQARIGRGEVFDLERVRQAQEDIAAGRVVTIQELKDEAVTELERDLAAALKRERDLRAALVMARENFAARDLALNVEAIDAALRADKDAET